MSKKKRTRRTKAQIQQELNQAFANPTPNGCILAPRVSSTGYASDWVHYTLFEAVNGPVPKGLVLAHSCNVKSCINPTHLSAVTQSKNIQDAYRFGQLRPYRGRHNRLTKEQVNKIQALYGAGLSQVEIAKIMGVRYGRVNDVCNNRFRYIRAK